MKSRQEIKALAKEAFRAQRGTARLLVLVGFLLSFAVGFVAAIFMLIHPFFYFLAFLAGMAFLYVMIVNWDGEELKIFNRETASVGALFSGLKVNFWRKLGGMLWMMLFIFLWSLIPIAGWVLGIIKGLAYSMTPYILASCPNVEAKDALKLSIRMTDGHKGKLFVLGLSFIGWMLLSSLTLGIVGIIFAFPYMFITYAGFFVELRDKAIADGKITREELGMDAIEG